MQKIPLYINKILLHLSSQLLTTSNTPNRNRSVMVGQDRTAGRLRNWHSMALLDEVIKASGGLGRWNELRRFTLHLSIEGTLFSRFGQAGRFKDLVAEGSIYTQSVRFTGFTGPEHSALYEPDCVTIES